MYYQYFSEVIKILWLKLKQWLKRRKTHRKMLSIVITEEEEK